MATVVAELSDKFRRIGKGNVWEQQRRMVLKLRSRIVSLSEPAANKAGKIKRQQRETFPDFPLADGIILALARASRGNFEELYERADSSMQREDT